MTTGPSWDRFHRFMDRMIEVEHQREREARQRAEGWEPGEPLELRQGVYAPRRLIELVNDHRCMPEGGDPAAEDLGLYCEEAQWWRHRSAARWPGRPWPDNPDIPDATRRPIRIVEDPQPPEGLTP